MAFYLNRAKVVIAGRPNVGKSTLFNRLAGKKLALVDDTPGVTRDTKLVRATLGSLEFDIYDTAGIEFHEEGIAQRLNRIALQTIKESDVVIFMLDGKDGLTPGDEEIANQLRQMHKEIILVINKSDVHASEDTIYEIYSLGFGDALLISAEHGRGLGELEERLRPIVEEAEDREVEDTVVTMPVAVLGRPNAGKSTLINQLLQSERMLTGPEAGLTRESVASLWQYEDRLIELVDTPGVRKKAKVTDELERMSVTSAMGSIAKSEGVILMLDATCPFEKQDAILAERAVQMGKPLIIGLNKWDLVEDKDKAMEEMRYLLETKFSQVKGVPLIPMSALKGKHIEKLMPALIELHKKWQTRISTSHLNQFLEGMLETNPPPMRRNRRLKIKYIAQTDIEPPTFTLMCNMPEELPSNYLRYLLNGLREAFDLYGIVIHLNPKGSHNPYAAQKKR